MTQWKDLLKDREFVDDEIEWIITDVRYMPEEKTYAAIYIEKGKKDIQANREYTPILELLEDGGVKWKTSWDFERYIDALS